jgi:5-methylcytosine-specific restriction endonuclease McrA
MKKTKLQEQTDQIKILVNTCTTISEICEELGYTKTGYNFKRIKQIIADEKLTMISTDKWSCGNHRTSLDDILVVDSNYTNNFRLKSRLVKEEILEYKCSECRNDGKWNGKPLSLQLDHINGVNNDNRIENLRFLCPNCHSQTPTFCGKKRS